MKRLLYVVNFWVKKKKRSDIIFVGFSSMNILVEFFNFVCCNGKLKYAKIIISIFNLTFYKRRLILDFCNISPVTAVS